MPTTDPVLILPPTTPEVLLAPPTAPALLLAAPTGAPVLLGPVLGAPVLLGPVVTPGILLDTVTTVLAPTALTVDEVDGTPSDPATIRITFPNGTLTDVAGHVTYTPGPPTAHHPTHSTGGSDAIAPADIGALSGTGTAGQVVLWSGAGVVSGDPRVTVGLGGLIVVGAPGYEAIYGQTDTSTAIDGEAFGAGGTGVYGSGSGTGGKGLIGEVTVTDGVPITALAPSGATANLVEAQVNAVLAFAVGPTGRPRWVSTPPTSSTDTGTVGEVAWDSGFLYVAVATNTWKRVALSTF